MNDELRPKYDLGQLHSRPVGSHTAAELTRAKALPEASSFGIAQMLKSDRLRQPTLRNVPEHVQNKQDDCRDYNSVRTSLITVPVAKEISDLIEGVRFHKIALSP